MEVRVKQDLAHKLSWQAARRRPGAPLRGVELGVRNAHSQVQQMASAAGPPQAFDEVEGGGELEAVVGHAAKGRASTVRLATSR